MDRYTKFVLTVIAAALVVIAGHLTIENTPSAWADTPAATEKAVICTWGYVSDSYNPEIGEAGKIEMDSDWTAMSKAGFRLVTAADSGEVGHVYIFEKCQ